MHLFLKLKYHSLCPMQKDGVLSVCSCHITLKYIKRASSFRFEAQKYCHIRAIQVCRYEGYGFQAVYSGIGYINQRVWVQNRVSFSRKLINWLKILVQTRETGNCHSKIYKISNRFCFGSSFWKSATLGQAGFREFNLVQGSKMQLNQLWYRLRVQGPSGTCPPQNSLIPPPRAPPVRDTRTEE